MKKVLATFALLSTVAATSAFAKDVKHISKTVKVDEGQAISLNVPVGSLKVETCTCNEVTLDIRVESSEGSWSIFSSGGDVDNAELSIRERRSSMIFEVDEDDTKQKWTVTVPVSSALNIEMGVGEVDVNDLNNDLNAEVGVGSINVDLQGDDYRRIDLESGVGDTSIKGFGDKVTTKRSIVSSSAKYRGDGEYSVTVEVGVGEADIRNN
jgi:hypothetical protein